MSDTTGITPVSADRIDVSKYLSILRDPIDGGELELTEDGSLAGLTSGLAYGWVGAFPDLRPGHGESRNVQGGDVHRSESELARSERAMIASAHYDRDPCHNYLELDNVPLGRYLRDDQYAPFFEGVELLLEVGAGKGIVAEAFRAERGITPLCVDIAYGSLRHVRRPELAADGVLGSNLSIPLADNSADMVVSYGVVMITPDPMRCLAELARVLKPGGKLLFSIYNWDSIHRSLYFFVSPPLKAIRRFLGPRLGDLFLKLTVFVPYHLAMWIVLIGVQGRWRFPNIGQSYSQFADFFLTPFNRFYHQGELKTMGELVGLRLIEQETGGWPRDKFSHFAWYEK